MESEGFSLKPMGALFEFLKYGHGGFRTARPIRGDTRETARDARKSTGLSLVHASRFLGQK
jgi:hypothetical protein